MQTDDFKEFSALLDATYDMIGVGPAKVISPTAKAMFFGDLQHYDLDLVRGALMAHRQDPERGRFTPKTADVVYQIERRRAVQWVAADEAWAQVPKLEREPGLLNQVTAAALAAASEFLDMPRPDLVAARMAFKSTYDRLAEQEKLAGRPPKYWPSPGGTHEEFEAVKAEGVRLGLLPPSFAPATAPQLGHTTTADRAKFKQALAGLQMKSLPPPEAE